MLALCSTYFRGDINSHEAPFFMYVEKVQRCMCVSEDCVVWMSLAERKWLSHVPEKSFWSPHLFSLQNAVYKGEFTATHPTVRLFWEVFHEFPLEKKKQFLRKHSTSSLLDLLDSLISLNQYYKYCKDVQVVPWLSYEYTVKSFVVKASCVVLHERIKAYFTLQDAWDTYAHLRFIIVKM